MTAKLVSTRILGLYKTWDIVFEASPEYLAALRADGLEVYEVLNTIPVWIARLGLVRPWCFLQDLFNFKNPWK